MGRHHDERMHVDFAAIFKQTMVENQRLAPGGRTKSQRVLKLTKYEAPSFSI
jgi:hypothetical protein